MRSRFVIGLAALLSGCATTNAVQPDDGPVHVKIIAFNDFHGALEPPHSAVSATAPDGRDVRVPAGGAAYLASAIDSLRSENPNHAVVTAGDLISASPLISAQFLDEPTILAMNLIGIDLSAVGNHEFDRGRAELLRMQNGGCEKNTKMEPCRVEPFPGARFGFLAANVETGEGGTLFPGHAIRSFGSGAGEVRVGFIGLTLKDTPTLVTPSGVAGLSFEDEADTINALVPELRREGADAIVVLIHQGLSTKVGYDDKSCGGIDGDLLPILARLDSEVDLVVSGHTHNAYLCDYGRIDPDRPFLVTSAGRSGTLLTDIDLAIDPERGEVVGRTADHVIVQGEGYVGGSGEVPVTDLYPRFGRDPDVAALVERYRKAVEPVAGRVVGRIDGPALRERSPSGESVLGNLVADAHLAAARGAGAQIAFTNGSGVRADIIPAANGAVTYGQLFTTQPFGNSITVKTFTGAQLRRLLEQQFDSGWNTIDDPNMLAPSAGFTYSYDLTKPAGQRISGMRLDGQPIRDDATYRVAMNSFLASGGDNFTIFREGTDVTGGPQDLDALEAYLAAAGTLKLPETGRITRIN